MEALAGSQLIIHAGDVGKPEILDILATIAPVTAVRGNIDKAEWAERLPETQLIEAGRAHIYVLHDLKQLDLDAAKAGIQIVVSGHSHKPQRYTKDGVLFFNPGSAGPRRFRLPITVGRLDLRMTPWGTELIDVSA